MGQLVLERGPDEKVNLYRRGVLLGSVLVVKGSIHTKLGFDFGRDIEIVREELDVHVQPLTDRQ